MRTSEDGAPRLRGARPASLRLHAQSPAVAPSFGAAVFFSSESSQARIASTFGRPSPSSPAGRPSPPPTPPSPSPSAARDPALGRASTAGLGGGMHGARGFPQCETGCGVRARGSGLLWRDGDPDLQINTPARAPRPPCASAPASQTPPPGRGGARRPERRHGGAAGGGRGRDEDAVRVPGPGDRGGAGPGAGAGLEPRERGARGRPRRRPQGRGRGAGGGRGDLGRRGRLRVLHGGHRLPRPRAGLGPRPPPALPERRPRPPQGLQRRRRGARESVPNAPPPPWRADRAGASTARDRRR